MAGFDPQAFVSGGAKGSGKFNPEAFVGYVPQMYRTPQTPLDAAKFVLGSRSEIRPYSEPEIPTFTGDPLKDAMMAAKATLEIPTRTGATLNEAFSIPEEAGKRYGFPLTGKIISTVAPFLVGGGGPRNLPAAGVGREAAVSAAEEFGIPLSRAERTGSPIVGGLETTLENTPLGKYPIRAARNAEATARQNVLKRVSEELGTTESPGVVGQKAKDAYSSARKTASEAKDTLYSQVPDNVYVPLENAKNTAQTLLDEQSKLYPGTQSPEVMRWTKIIQEAETSSGKGVTGGPEVSGVTTNTSDIVIPPTQAKLSPNLSYEPGTPGQTISGGPEYGVKYSVSPETPFAQKPNYYALKKLRGNLGEAIGQARKTGKYQDARDLTRLKEGLDSDINAFAENQTSPLESMTANEFRDTYRTANKANKGFMDVYENPDMKKLLMTDPEKVVGSIFKKGNVTEIQRFRAAVGEDAFGEAKKQFTQNMLDSDSPRKFLDKHESIIGTVYSPEEASKLNKLADVLELTKGSTRIPSEAGQLSGLGGSFTAAGYALKGGHPFVALTILGLPYLASKALVASAKGVPNLTGNIAVGIGSNVARAINK